MGVLNAKYFAPFVLEVPSGNVDGSNVTFTLSATPVGSTVVVTLNGLVQQPTTDYALSGATITMVTPPDVSKVILAYYQRAT